MHWLNVPVLWFDIWPEDGSMSRNMSPNFLYWLPICAVFIDWINYYIIEKHNRMASIKTSNVYFLIVAVEAYLRIWSHSETHVLGRTPLDDGSTSRRPLPDNIQYSQETDRHPCLRWDSNSQSQQASGRRLTP